MLPKRGGGFPSSRHELKAQLPINRVIVRWITAPKYYEFDGIFSSGRGSRRRGVWLPPQAVILAGGSGTRLWPLSREHFPEAVDRASQRRVAFFNRRHAASMRLRNARPVAEEVLVVCGEDHPVSTTAARSVLAESGVIIPGAGGPQYGADAHSLQALCAGGSAARTQSWWPCPPITSSCSRTSQHSPTL